MLGLAVLSSGERQPSRGWLTLLVGLVIIGVAMFYIYKAVSRRFTTSADLLNERGIYGTAVVEGGGPAQ